MSRIGKKNITIPQGVEVRISDQSVEVKGKLGSLSREFHPRIRVSQEGGSLVVAPRDDERSTGALWGLSRSLLNNMVTGVSKGFSKVLEINGVGYRAAVDGRNLSLSLGFSHPVNYPIRDGIDIRVEKNTTVTVAGIDPEAIGQTCAEIRKFRPPEPYKGKGIRYAGEHILRKEGKKK